MITEDNSLRIMKLFFENPEKRFHIRQIARLSGISSSGVIKIVKKLKKHKLLKSRKERMVEEVEADFDGRFLHVKRAYNLLSLHDSGLVPALQNFYEGAATIVFGSYSEGTDTSKSDIDIAVVTKSEKTTNLNKFEKRLNKKVNLMPISLENSTNEFKNSLSNGIVIVGYLDVAK
jgi:predicted nucleotidyltransferase